MSHSILITGASGYLGGSLLAQLSLTKLPPHKALYALIRSDQQAEQVKRYGAEPFNLDLEDESAVIKSIVDAKISIIFFLVDAVNSTFQLPLIKALGKLKKQNVQDVHFLHTSGAKMFSEHAGLPTDRELRDDDQGLFELQKTTKAPYDMMNTVGSPLCHAKMKYLLPVHLKTARTDDFLGCLHEQHRD
jgi:nucleoside-diphosphate-sugar epimerase